MSPNPDLSLSPDLDSDSKFLKMDNTGNLGVMGWDLEAMSRDPGLEETIYLVT